MERDLISGAVARLRSAGYSLVMTDVALSDGARLRVDVVAWGPSDDGELLPRVAVEVKSSGRPEAALPILSQARAALGTVDHLVVTEQGWFLAAAGARSVEPVHGPNECRGPRGVVRAAGLAASLLEKRVWREADRLRTSGQGLSLRDAFAAVVSTMSNGEFETDGGDRVLLDPAAWQQAKLSVWDLLSERDVAAGSSSSLSVVATAVAALAGDKLGGTVLDPFCGAGRFLLAVRDRAVQEERLVRLLGRDLNGSILETAEQLAGGADLGIDLAVGDAFAGPLPEADVIVTAPPMGLRLAHAQQLSDGNRSKLSEAVAVDRCLAALKPGGRAVFQLSPSFIFHTGLEAFRSHVASQFRVAALIGCPSGAVLGTQVKSLLLVIDKASPGTTFVAQLAEDWQLQLGPDGPAVTAALQHIDATDWDRL